MNQHTSSQQTLESPSAALEGFELRYCYLCDADAPHLSLRTESDYVFQCGACFATHVEPLPDELLVPGSGRHRAA